MKKIFELKARIKNLAAAQKQLRNERKASYTGARTIKASSVYRDWQNAISAHLTNKYELRHLHIAYCLLRGRDMKCIETKCMDNNKPSQHKIDAIMKEYSDVEALCVNQG